MAGKNSWGKIGWGGPMPPRGSGVHRYRFHIYALDTKLDLPPGATKAELLAAMKGHVYGKDAMTGTYERKKE